MKARPYLPYGRQHITEDDIAEVAAVLRSEFLTQGPAVKSFENAICAYTGARYAVAINSATSGLHVACRTMGLKKGGLLWTSPITFVASANCALLCGADVDFVDIDPETFNLSIEALEEKLKTAKRLPDIVVPVHLSGVSCDMPALQCLSEKYGFKILEDAAHAIGGTCGERKIGDCTHSACSVFSFHPVKIVTTGEGGVVTTNDEQIYRTLLKLRSHGITREPGLLENAPHGEWYYEMQDLSCNYRMTDIQAALGSSQMKKLDAFVDRRNELARLYTKCLSGAPIGVQKVPEGHRASYHLFIVQVDEAKRDTVFDGMRAASIGVNLHYIPVYLQPYYKRLGFMKGTCPRAERYYARALSIPLFPQMTDDDVNYVSRTLLRLVGQ